MLKKKKVKSKVSFRNDGARVTQADVLHWQSNSMLFLRVDVVVNIN